MSNSLHIGMGMMLFLVALALIFDFMNGFHDSANSIATVVSTGVLKPHHAVLMAASFNFIAFYVLPHKVAATIGKGIIQGSVVDQYVIFGALMGAIIWNVITWYYGIPSSSSRLDGRTHRCCSGQKWFCCAHRRQNFTNHHVYLHLACFGLFVGLNHHAACRLGFLPNGPRKG